MGNLASMTTMMGFNTESAEISEFSGPARELVSWPVGQIATTKQLTKSVSYVYGLQSYKCSMVNELSLSTKYNHSLGCMHTPYSQ